MARRLANDLAPVCSTLHLRGVGSRIGPERRRCEGMTEGDGSFRLSTYAAFDGAQEGEYTVTVVWRRPLFDAASAC